MIEVLSQENVDWMTGIDGLFKLDELSIDAGSVKFTGVQVASEKETSEFAKDRETFRGQ